MERISKGIYTKKFREEAVKLITEGGIGIKEASNRLSLPSSTLSYWVKAYKGGRIRLRKRVLSIGSGMWSFSVLG